jgi:hypothetical protein
MRLPGGPISPEKQSVPSIAAARVLPKNKEMMKNTQKQKVSGFMRIFDDAPRHDVCAGRVRAGKRTG